MPWAEYTRPPDLLSEVVFSESEKHEAMLKVRLLSARFSKSSASSSAEN